MSCLSSINLRLLTRIENQRSRNPRDWLGHINMDHGDNSMQSGWYVFLAKRPISY